MLKYRKSPTIRSFIISIDKIESYSAEIVEIKGVSIPIGRGYKFVIENL